MPAVALALQGTGAEYLLPVLDRVTTPLTTATTSSATTKTLLAPRQATTTSAPAPDSDGYVAIPSTYGALNSSPSPGLVAGIVLGSVGGFLFVLFLLYSCFAVGPPFGFIPWIRPRPVVVETEEIDVGRSGIGVGVGGVHGDDEIVVEEEDEGRTRKKRRRRRRSPRVSGTYQVRTREHFVEEPLPGRPPIPRPPPPPMNPDPRSRGRAPPPPRMVPSEYRRVSVADADTDSDSDDEVVVFEEHDDDEDDEEEEAQRRRRRRSEQRRRESGYRDVDPYRFAGGDAPMRNVSRRRSSSRRP